MILIKILSKIKFYYENSEAFRNRIDDFANLFSTANFSQKQNLPCLMLEEFPEFRSLHFSHFDDFLAGLTNDKKYTCNNLDCCPNSAQSFLLGQEERIWKMKRNASP